MGNKQLVDFLTAENALDGTEPVYIAQDGKTRKTFLQKIKDFIIGTTTMGTTATDVTGAVAELKESVDLNTTQLNASAKKTSADINYYVSPSGSDLNDGLTSDKPFKTIQHVLDVLPNYINHKIIINLAQGTYDGFIYKGFVGGGSISIIGGDSSNYNNYIINGNVMLLDSPIYTNFKFFRVNEHRLGVYGCNRVALNYIHIDGESENGLIADASFVEFTDSAVWNKTVTAVQANRSIIYLKNLGGDSNAVGLTSSQGAIISKDNCNINATTAEAKYNGGMIVG